MDTGRNVGQRNGAWGEEVAAEHLQSGADHQAVQTGRTNQSDPCRGIPRILSLPSKNVKTPRSKETASFLCPDGRA